MCGWNLQKWFIMYTVVAAVSGVCFMVIGTIIYSDLYVYHKYLHDDVLVASIMMVILGGIILLVSLQGCCGAVYRVACMVSLFGYFLILVLVIKIIIGILAFVYSGTTEHINNDELKKDVEDSNDSNIAVIQKALSCCGSNDFKDSEKHPLPETCCTYGETICYSSGDADDHFLTGCKEALWDYVQCRNHLVGVVVLATIVLEIIGIILAFLLAKSLKEQEDEEGGY